MKFTASKSSGEVSAYWLRPDGAKALLVLGHGAGVGSRHAFMESLAHGLAQNAIATLRYDFPYTEAGRKVPDPKPILLSTVRNAIAFASGLKTALPLFVGGKSMGGRMSSTLLAEEPHSGVRGIVFFGFPLHAPGKPSVERADHLDRIRIPMLFLQGTRDPLADVNHIRSVHERLGERSTLHIIEGGDHSFRVPKSSGRASTDAMEEIVRIAAEWMGL